MAGLALTGAAQPSAPPAAELEVALTGLRNAKGVVRVCLTPAAPRFLECKASGRVERNLPAGNAGKVAFPKIAPGTYALLVIHDENGDGRLDMTLGIPREGFGFSYNPAIRPRPPRFEEVRFEVRPGRNSQTVRIRYML